MSDAATKLCVDCGEDKPLGAYSRHGGRRDQLRAYCKPCSVLRVQDYKRRNPRWELGYRLKRKYGLTIAAYDAMLAEQNERCAICREPFDDTRARYVCVDHDHATGAVRGLLCFNCNTVLGKVRDKPELLFNAIHYLERHTPKTGAAP